jgi:hypothetical protein
MGAEGDIIKEVQQTERYLVKRISASQAEANQDFSPEEDHSGSKSVYPNSWAECRCKKGKGTQLRGRVFFDGINGWNTPNGVLACKFNRYGPKNFVEPASRK